MNIVDRISSFLSHMGRGVHRLLGETPVMYIAVFLFLAAYDQVMRVVGIVFGAVSDVLLAVVEALLG